MATLFVDARMQALQLAVNVKHEDLLADLVLQRDFAILQLMIIINVLPNLLVNDHAQEIWEPLDANELGSFWIELAIGPKFVEYGDSTLFRLITKR